MKIKTKITGLVAATILLCFTVLNVAPALSGYSPEARQAIQDFVDFYGKKSPDYNANSYVVSDFDNTTAIFDIADQCAIYQLESMSFGMNPEELLAALGTDIDLDEENSSWLEDIGNAYTYLYSTYGPFTPAGLDESVQATIAKDPQWQEFATKMRCFYNHIGSTTSEDVSYKWVLYWYSGMTRDEVYDMFYRSCSKYKDAPTSRVTWTSPKELSSKMGAVSCDFTCGVSVAEDVKDMMAAIHNSNINLWICSASHLDGVRAAVDAYGLSDSVTGVIGMTQKLQGGKYIPAYDFETGNAFMNEGNGKWAESSFAIKALPVFEGKVTAIENALIPMYGTGPLAGFMDSSGDFNFCTEFDSMKLVICYNRANRKITEGGGLIGVVATYQKESLGYDLKKAIEAGDTYYVLQGRDENGTRSLRPSDETLRFEETTPKRFANEDNEALLNYLKENKLSTKEFLDTFAIATAAEAEGNPLGLKYGYLKEYRGYHSIR